MCQSAKAQNYGQYGQVPKCQTVANVPHHKFYLHLPIDFFTNTGQNIYLSDVNQYLVWDNNQNRYVEYTGG